MAEFLGRDVTLILADGTTALCFRTLGISFPGDSLDISDGCSNGFRELSRRGPSQQAIDLTGEGVAKTTFLRRIMLQGGNRYLEGVTLEWPADEEGGTGDRLTVDLVIADYSESLTYNDITTFSMTLNSSGEWLFVEGTSAPVVPD